jgi:hypothetical protein
VPVTLTFAPVAAAAFIGDESLWAGVWRIAGTRGVVVCARTGAALYPGPGAQRRALARASRLAVA